MLADLLDGVLGGDQLGAGRHIHAEEAGVADRRRGDAHVDFGRAGLAQQLDDSRRGGAAHDRVVDHGHAAPVEHRLERVVLEVRAEVADALVGLDEGAPHVAVLDQPLGVGQAGFVGVADGVRGGGVGHADHDVGVGRVLAGELAAHPLAGLEGEPSVEEGVGPREVDVLEDAAGRRPRLGDLAAAQAVGVDRDQLAGMHIAHVGRADVVQRAGFGGDDVAAVDRADAERPHAERVARGHQAVGREQDDRVGGLDAVHQRGEARFPIAVLVEQVAPQDLGVGRGREAVAALGQLGADFGGVDHVAVVRDAHGPAVAGVLEQDRLGVAEAAGAGRRVAGVADRRDAVERAELVLGEDLRDEPHAGLQRELPAVGGADAGALLPAVLERVDAVEGEPRHIDGRRPDAEDAASFAGRVGERRHFRARFVCGGTPGGV